MTIAFDTDAPLDTETTYEVVFCAPAEALHANQARWFIEGCYLRFEDAQRAAKALIEATSAQLHAVSILHAQFDPQRAAYRERVVWSQDLGIALLSRLNLQPLQNGERESIVAYCDDRARDAAAQRPVMTLPGPAAPSPVLLGLAGTLVAALCAAGVLLILA